MTTTTFDEYGATEPDNRLAQATALVEDSDGLVLSDSWFEKAGIEDHYVDKETGELWLKCWVRFPDGMQR